MIEIKNLTKKFHNHLVLDDVSFSLPDSGIVVFEGENGSGKTTLLNILDLMDDDFSGQYLFNGVDVKTLKEKDKASVRGEFFSYVCQKHNLIRYLTQEENVELKSLINGDKIQLQKNEDWHKLSQGQQEILVLEREIKPGKHVYLLDEVTASLDEKHQQWVISQIARLSHESLAIIVCHDLDLKGQADFVYHLKKGKIEMIKGTSSTAEKVTSSLRLEKRIHKGIPYSLALKRWKASWLLDCFMFLISIMTTALCLLGIEGFRPNAFGELLSACGQSTSILVQQNDLQTADELLNHFKGFSYRSWDYRMVFSNDVPADGKIYCNNAAYQSLSYTSADSAIKGRMEELGYVIDDSIKDPYFFINDALVSAENNPFMFELHRNVLMKDGQPLKSDLVGDLYCLNQKAYEAFMHEEIKLELEDDVFYMNSVPGGVMEKAVFEYQPSNVLYQDFKEQEFNSLFPDGVTLSSIEELNPSFILVSNQTMEKLLTRVTLDEYVLVELGHNTFQQLFYISQHHLHVSDPYGSSRYDHYNGVINSALDLIGNTTYKLLFFVMVGVHLVISSLVIISKSTISRRDDWILQLNGLSKNKISIMNLLFDVGVFLMSIPFAFLFLSFAQTPKISLDVLFTIGFFGFVILFLMGLHMVRMKRLRKRK